MPKYVNVEKAFEEITEFAGSATTKGAYAAYWKSAKAVRAMGAEPDVVKVVRCKDCIYYKRVLGAVGGWCDCEFTPFDMDPDDFCSHGKKEQGE